MFGCAYSPDVGGFMSGGFYGGAKRAKEERLDRDEKLMVARQRAVKVCENIRNMKPLDTNLIQNATQALGMLVSVADPAPISGMLQNMSLGELNVLKEMLSNTVLNVRNFNTAGCYTGTAFAGVLEALAVLSTLKDVIETVFTYLFTVEYYDEGKKLFKIAEFVAAVNKQHIIKEALSGAAAAGSMATD